MHPDQLRASSAAGLSSWVYDGLQLGYCAPFRKVFDPPWMGETVSQAT
jgi:hypothetical protein